MNTKTLTSKIDKFIQKNKNNLDYVIDFYRNHGKRAKNAEKDLAKRAIKSLHYSPRTKWGDVINTLIRRHLIRKTKNEIE